MSAEVAWRLRPGEPLREEFARLAREEARRAREELSAPDLPRSQAIHQARRRFKKIRALVRLARPCLGSDYARENGRWRDLGRQLAASRDATVLLGTFDRVAAGLKLPVRHRAALRRRLAAPEQAEAGQQDDDGVEQVASQLDEAIRAIGQLKWPRDLREIRRGLRDSQSRLRRRWKEAGEAAAGADSEALHDWRKRVKDMSSQLGLFRALLPAELKAQRKTAKLVAELLGEEHDLYLLGARMSEPGLPQGLARSAAEMITAIDARRAELREEALALGKEFSACRPKELAQRVAENWPAAGAPKQAPGSRAETSDSLTEQ